MNICIRGHSCREPFLLGRGLLYDRGRKNTSHCVHGTLHRRTKTAFDPRGKMEMATRTELAGRPIHTDQQRAEWLAWESRRDGTVHCSNGIEGFL